MYFAYLDDSADDRRERYVVSGGLVAHQIVWDNFEILWLNATHELTKPFHATDCETGQGEFFDSVTWPKTRRDTLMATLVGLVRRYRLGGFASVVPVADYRAVFPESEKHAPYSLALKHTLVNMAHIGMHTGDRVKCCFEKGDTDNKSRKIFGKIIAVTSWKNRRSLAEISFGSKKLVPLQAADLLAREAFKHYDNIGSRPTRKPVIALANQISFHLWTRATLEHLKSLGGPENLEALTSWPETGPPPLQHYYPKREK